MDEEITIAVTITVDGKVRVQVKGVPGMACLSQTEDLFRVLGRDLESQELTAEAYEEAFEQQPNRQQQWG